VHLCAGENRLDCLEWFQAALTAFEQKQPGLVDPRVLEIMNFPLIRPFIGHRPAQLMELFRAHGPYLMRPNCDFRTDRAESLLKSHNITCPNPRDYAPTLFEYCARTRWGKLPLFGEG